MNTNKVAVMFLLACVLGVPTVQGQTASETILFNFRKFPGGAYPYGSLFRSSNGALFGTAYAGGDSNLGTVFEWAGAGYKVLHSFHGGSDGSNPAAGVVQDSAGNLYGTTYFGGPTNAGVVYKVTPSGQETVLYAFAGGADGSNPFAGVILDSAGNLYGTTLYGGLTSCTGGCGVVYKVAPSGQFTALHSFTGGADGATPYAGVTSDSAGNLYGTTYGGGTTQGGVVYKLSPSGQETVLHTFGGNIPGGTPTAGVVRDSAGNLYGTARTALYEIEASGHFKNLAVFYCVNIGDVDGSGVTLDTAGNLYGTTSGPTGGNCGPQYGAVFKLTPSGALTELYRFPGASAPDIGLPNNGPYNLGAPGVVLDSAGTIYGTTPYGGVSGMIYKIGASGVTMLHNFTGAASGTSPNPTAFNPGGGFYGSTYYGGPANAGTVFEVDGAGHEKVLYSFTGGADGKYPNGVVARDSAGNIYGATSKGGTADQGVAYKVDPTGQLTVLHSFTGGADGGVPEGGLILGSDGNLYGTTVAGGSGSLNGVQDGVVFKMDTAGNETVLYSFTGLSDGGTPIAGPTRDTAGNLYGTTLDGGNAGAGVVYKISATGGYTVLYSFTGPGAGGGAPVSTVIRDSSGNLYGTASGWGITASGQAGEGLVFKLSPSGVYTVLYTFSGGADGGLPQSNVVLDKAGNLYGSADIGGNTALFGGLGAGVLFEISPSGQETVLYTFQDGIDGYDGGRLLMDRAGNLYGQSGGGALQGGLLYKMRP